MKYDVIVGGAGPAGICAAIAAKRGGANVLLIEGIKGGNPGNLRIENPLFVYENETSLNYSQEILDLFMLGKKE